MIVYYGIWGVRPVNPQPPPPPPPLEPAYCETKEPGRKLQIQVKTSSSSSFSQDFPVLLTNQVTTPRIPLHIVSGLSC